ncbi:PGAP1-like protein [Aureococcus anophagefferens]|nr:PGAP1-like protein [Aureococcus anophagefferens]
MSLDDDEKDAAEEKRTDSLMSLDDSKSGRAPSPWSVYEAAFVRREVAAGRLTDASLEDMLEPEDADAPPPLPPAPLLVEEEEAELLRAADVAGVPAPDASREEAEAAPPAPAEEPPTPPATRSRPSSPPTPPATRSRPSSPPAEAAPEPGAGAVARGSSAPASLRDYRDDVSVSVASEAPSSLVAALSSDAASPGPRARAARRSTTRRPAAAAPPPPPSPGRLAFRGPSAEDLAAIDPRPDRAASPSAGGFFAPFSEGGAVVALLGERAPSPPIPSAFSSPVVSGSSAPPSVRGDASVVSCDADGRSPRDAEPGALAGALSPTTFSRLTDSFLNLRAADDIGRLVGDDVADMVAKVKATRANRKKKPKRRRAPSV